MARSRRAESAAAPAELPNLPAELRQRPANPSALPIWRTARRTWEQDAGVTVAELWAAELAAARRIGHAAVNELYAPGRCIEPEHDDPRIERATPR